MRFLVALMIAVHGIAHLVGFAMSWQLSTSAEMPYRTSILNGRVELGSTGIRAYGIAWLLLALAFLVVAAGVGVRAPWSYRLGAWTVAVSMLWCLLSWPDSRFGLLVNGAIVVIALVGLRLGWPANAAS